MYELAKQYKEIENELFSNLEQFITEIGEVIENGLDDVIHHDIFNLPMYNFGSYDVKVNDVGEYGFKVHFTYSDRYDPYADHYFEITIRKEWVYNMNVEDVYNDMVERSKPLFEQDKQTDKLRLERLAEASGYLLIPKAKVEWYNKDKGALV